MKFQRASEADFRIIQKFYWDVIEDIHRNNVDNEKLGWGKGIGKIVVKNILDIAKAEHKKAVRLDVLGACKAAECLYTSCGFQFVEAKQMFYEDTGWTEYKMFELNL